MNSTEFDQQSSFTFARKEVEVRRERQSETGEGWIARKGEGGGMEGREKGKLIS